jgi:GcrA cell cycle regulator
MAIWSEEAVSQLRGLAEQGYSASQAAAQINGMTRNAAVGVAFRRKFHFMGGKGGGPNHLGVDAKPKRKKSDYISIPKRSYRKAPELVIALSTAVTEAEVAPRRKISIMELTENTCRWPLGDTLALDFGYCGAQPYPSYQYCASHCRMAYESPQERERARKEQGRPGFYRRADNQIRNGRAY